MDKMSDAGTSSAAKMDYHACLSDSCSGDRHVNLSLCHHPLVLLRQGKIEAGRFGGTCVQVIVRSHAQTELYMDVD